jgi:NDP-sugar pyrophosphorylase family protein
MLKPDDFFELNECKHIELFRGIENVWDVLTRIKPYIKKTIKPNVEALKRDSIMLPKTFVIYKNEVIDYGFEITYGDATKGKLKVLKNKKELKGASVICAGAYILDNDIEIGNGTVVEPGALIKGPSIIGNNTEVRQGAYIRGSCIVGDRCVVGHTTEMKNSVMLNDAKAGHFAYIGDSILGNNVNLGAGTKLANLKITNSDIRIRIKGKTYVTRLRKFGAILGDYVLTGCNSVTSPGTLLGKSSLVYPAITVQAGYYPELSVISVKTRGIIAISQRKQR